MRDPKTLPVYEQREKILSNLKDNQVIVVESPTGSGKTTQIPIILYEAGYAEKAMIGITQPRRIAAVSVSSYIDHQVNEKEGANFVGYKMRFDDQTRPNTKIKVMTDGILLQEIKHDPMLSSYSVLMVDEAHERSLNIDFILGLVKDILDKRPDLKLIISSATINAEVFSEYFDACPIVRIETPMYPVRTIFSTVEDISNPEVLLDQIANRVNQEIKDNVEGDILIFLPGEKLIKDCVARLYGLGKRNKLQILPLYGRLSKEEQDEVFPPPPEGKKKVVVSTNIAETSITIDGISTVIDSGLAKLNFYNPRTYTSSLIEKSISRASANQRKGRAGRTRPGTCYRMYSKDDFDRRPLFTQEEIYRTDLSEVVLRMAELGITDFEAFDFINSPGRGGIAGAVEILRLLDALEEDRSLTNIGRMMTLFPLLPRHSRVLVEAIHRYPKALRDSITIVSFLTSSHPYLLPQGEEIEARRAHHHFRDAAGDFISYLHLFNAFVNAEKKDKFCERYYLDQQIMEEIVRIDQQLQEIISDQGVPITNGAKHSQLLTCVATGLIQFICVHTGRGSFRSLTAEKIDIHPGSVLFRERPEFIVAGEIVKTTRTYARSVSPLERQWIKEINPGLAESLSKMERSGKKGKKGHDYNRKANAFTNTSSLPSSAEKDSTWQINLGGKIYALKAIKGKKKLLEIRWVDMERLLKLKEYSFPPQYYGIRVLVRYGQKNILNGERLDRALSIAEYINPDKDILARWPKGMQYNVQSKVKDLQIAFNCILKMTSGKNKDRSLSFLGLYTNDKGSYWLKPAGSFNAALTESIASLEAIIDELDLESSNESETQDQSEPGDALAQAIKGIYRRLVKIMESV
jgi:ATP-dependent helicase HrpA